MIINIKNSLYLDELKKLIRLSLPILFAQFSLMGLGLVDTLMSGRVGVADLAAIGLGTSLMMPVFMLSTGILLAISPLVAKAYGAKHTRQIAFIFHQGFWLSLPLGGVSMLILLNMDPFLQWLSLDAEVYQLTHDYLTFIAFGLPGIAFYQSLRFFWEGLGETLPTLLISFFALLLNIPLNAIFIYGLLGVHAYGAAGCGIASSLVMWSMLIAGMVYVHYSDKTKGYVSIKSLLSDLKLAMLDKWQAGRSILKLGIPNTLALLFEIGLFSFIAIFIAVLGPVVLAAHQVAMSISGFLFMIPLSLSLAASIRVGQLYGEGDYDRLNKMVKVSLLFAIFIALMMSVLILMLNEKIIALFTQDLHVVKIASFLLILAALYQITDAIQVVSTGILRGLHHTQTTMVVAFISYWVIGLGLGYILTFKDWIVPHMGVLGFWIGIAAGLTLGAILLGARLVYQLKLVKKGLAC